MRSSGSVFGAGRPSAFSMRFIRSMLAIPPDREGSLPTLSGRTVTVIDASVLVAYALREDGWVGVEGLLRERPHSIELLPVEAANAVLMALRKRRISEKEAEEALRIVHELSETGFTLVSHLPLLLSAWEIAQQHEITVCDAAYLALARRERTAIVSRDSAQVRVARALGLRVLEG